MNNALLNNRPTRGRDDASMYDVTTYTDVELFNILDVDSPTDRELEAKIIFLINKYKNIQNASGDQLAEFFEKIYRRFFEAEEDEMEIENFEDEDDDDAEGFANIREGLTNQEIVKLTTPPANKVTNVTNTTGPSSAITANQAVQGNSVVKPSPDNIGYTKSLEYANGKLNPLLQQTIKRIISIDSQYRDDKRTLSTEFTFNLSDPLKDVVSLKLYSVQIPYTWYTINNNFGSNFFVLKGDVDGINNGNHDYQIDIAAGNYSPQSLIDTINEGITLAKNTYSDVSFGNTVLAYNSNTSLITTTIDLYKQYNETSYYLKFPTKWSGVTTDAVRLSTIPGFLGFTQETYEMFHLESERTLPLTTDVANENTRFAIDSNNNYFTVYKYIGDEYDENQVGKVKDVTLNIVIGLADGSYTRAQITTALNNAIQNNKYLSTSETEIQHKSGLQRIDLINNSYFLLKLKSNRYTTNNIGGSKIQVRFPLETGADKKIWIGSNSCFQFNPNSSRVMEMNNLISEFSPMQQSDAQYIIASSPYINLVCKSAGYDVSNTRYKIKVDNAVTLPYNLTNYISAINNGFATVDNSINFTADNTLVKIDSEKFNAQIDLTKNITTPRFKLDLTESFLHTDLNFDSSYNLDMSGGVYTATFGFKFNYTIPSTTLKLATFSGQVPGEFMTSDLSYTVFHPMNTNIDVINNTASTPYLSGTERALEVKINQQFENFKDSDGVSVLSGTNIRFVANQDNTLVTATLTVSVNKQLTESDYSIQFLEDISYNITQTGFKLDVSGGVPNAGTYIRCVNDVYDLSDGLIPSGLGVLSSIFDLSGGGFDEYDMQTANLFTSQFDTSDISNNLFIIDTSYIAFLAVTLNPAVDTPYYGRSFRYGSIVPYGYLIPSPTTRTYNTINGLVSAINTQFNLFPDLSGTALTISQISTTTRYNASLRVVVNQRYNQDTWYKNLKISHQMIDASWNLSNITDLSLSYSKPNEYGSVALGIKGESIIQQKAFACTSANNRFELIPYEEGVISTNNNLIFTLPLKNADGTTITYTRARLLDEINTQFLGTVAAGSRISIITSDTGVEYTKFRITINKEYTSKDYRIVYYDPYSFVKCFSGVNSVRNVTWDTTLGWILGYRLSTIYYLSDYTSTRTVTITADTCISTNLFNYFLITLDDYNQNHLNDGLVTVTARDTDIPLPSYANRTNYTCDPVTKELTYNTEQRTDYSKLTQNQIYALNQVANSKNTLTNQVTAGEVSSKNYGSGPFAKDVFGIIPLKLAGLYNGSSFVEFGGTLQNQERIYFGPVNIHRMSVKLLSDRGNVVDLNGANWSFSLVCEQLYRPQQRE